MTSMTSDACNMNAGETVQEACVAEQSAKGVTCLPNRH